MKELNQQLFNFELKKNLEQDDFYVSSCNYYAYELINSWPKWGKNIINVCGEKYSGKSHLANIFIKKFKGKIIDSNSFDDEMIYALLVKNFSDRQILIEKKLIDFIIKRIDRSYGKIFEFIYKIDEISLKKKKPIDFKIIKEVLKE